jgi:hypothetical protein
MLRLSAIHLNADSALGFYGRSKRQSLSLDGPVLRTRLPSSPKALCARAKHDGQQWRLRELFWESFADGLAAIRETAAGNGLSPARGSGLR